MQAAQTYVPSPANVPPVAKTSRRVSGGRKTKSTAGGPPEPRITVCYDWIDHKGPRHCVTFVRSQRRFRVPLQMLPRDATLKTMGSVSLPVSYVASNDTLRRAFRI